MASKDTELSKWLVSEVKKRPLLPGHPESVQTRWNVKIKRSVGQGFVTAWKEHVESEYGRGRHVKIGAVVVPPTARMGDSATNLDAADIPRMSSPDTRLHAAPRPLLTVKVEASGGKGRGRGRGGGGRGARGRGTRGRGGRLGPPEPDYVGRGHGSGAAQPSVAAAAAVRFEVTSPRRCRHGRANAGPPT